MSPADADDCAKLARRKALECVAVRSSLWRRATLLAMSWATYAAILRLRERQQIRSEIAKLTRGGPKE
jgi:hypothetical protein